MNVYFKPAANRKKEMSFFNQLNKKLGGVNHICQNYKFPNSMLDFHLNIPSITQKLKKEKKLSALKKDRLLDVLSQLPNTVKVAENISNVSVDFAIENNDTITFIEFHEQQHRNISDARIKPIFTPDNRRIEIPRYSQRFLKDIWRVEFLKNYKIVWWDWFEKNGINEFDIYDKKSEYFLREKFSFMINFG